MKLPQYIREGHKLLGYFAYTRKGEVFCDGDACVIAGSQESLKGYMAGDSDAYTIKKTRFSDVMAGLGHGGAYAFNQESYERFLAVASKNGMQGLPSGKSFSESASPMKFLRIQVSSR